MDSTQYPPVSVWVSDIPEDIVSGYVRALIVKPMHCSTNEQIIVSRLSLEFLLTSLSTQTEPHIDTFRSKRFQRSNSEVIPDGTFRWLPRGAMLAPLPGYKQNNKH